MAINWNNRIDEYYNKKKNNSSVSWVQLLDLVESQIDLKMKNYNTTPDLHENVSDEELMNALDEYSKVSSYNLLNEVQAEPSKGEKLILSLPKYTPSEDWGKSESESRIEIKKFVENIRGKTIQDRFDFLMKIQQPKSGIKSTRRIISSIILLESLKSLLNAYGASTAGYVFEGFIAALMNGEQVTDPPEGSLPIEDVMAFTYEGKRPGIPVSLKLLREKGDTKGSFRNLVDSLYRRGSKGMAYIVVFKEGEEGMQLRIKEFTFTNRNMVPILSEGAGTNVNLFKPNKALMKNLSLQAREAGKESLAQHAMTFSRARKDMSREVMLAHEVLPPSEYYLLLQATEGYSHERVNEAAGGTQFYIYETFFRKELKDVIEHGVINVSDSAILDTVNLYIDILNESISTLFSAVASLNDNINQYFVSADRDKAIRNGREAMDNTKEIRKSLTSEMKDSK
jgi:hypothetical protein